jgi:hypothetical protein
MDIETKKQLRVSVWIFCVMLVVTLLSFMHSTSAHDAEIKIYNEYGWFSLVIFIGLCAFTAGGIAAFSHDVKKLSRDWNKK